MLGLRNRFLLYNTYFKLCQTELFMRAHVPLGSHVSSETGLVYVLS